MTISVALAGVSGISSVSGTPGNVAEWQRRFRITQRRPLSNLSVSLPLDSSPEKGSPWQRGFVFDETDWGLLENVAGCQSLPLWERWHCEAMTERARMLTKSKKHSDTSPVCQRHRIAVLSCFILPGLPSQALARQLSQRESPWQRGQALVYASMPWSAGG